MLLTIVTNGSLSRNLLISLIKFGKNVLEHKRELWEGDLIIQPTILLQLDYCEGVEEMGA
jgi:hypothetical protein